MGTSEQETRGRPEDGGSLTPLEFVLGEGSHTQREALRAEIADDPLLAFEVADTVALLEDFRQVEVEPSARFGCLLMDIVRRAERRIVRPVGVAWPSAVACAAAAAAAAFLVLWQWDPLGLRTPPQGAERVTAALVVLPDVPADHPAESPVVVREAAELAWENAVEAMRRRLELESAQRLSQAFESALRREADPLARWLDPRNALAMLRVEHELRGSAEIRLAALRAQGGLLAVDARVQDLADLVAADLLLRLPSLDGSGIRDVALAVRALLAAGPGPLARERALLAAGDWLAAQLPGQSGVGLSTALGPLVELAAVQGRHVGEVREHGERFVAEVLRADQDTWGRRRPEVLGASVLASTIADAGRMLGLLPGFGVDAGRCGIVRQLMLGRLQERRDLGEDGPEVLVAMVFGCADLLAEEERDDVERQLRRWSPLRLAPDFVTVYQLAFAIDAGRLGHTHLRRELRRLAVLPDPGELGSRSAFCLCLASSYGAGAAGDLHQLASGD